jgi:ribose transport system ATP-binding protein
MLRVEKLSRGDAVRDVSFEVKRGEIFGISGLIGSGRTELLRAIFGADAKDAGTVSIGTPPRPVHIGSPADAVKQGMALITEDRKSEGLMLPQSIASNLALNNFGVVSRFGWIDGGRERALAQRHIDAMRIRCSDGQQAVGELSGGNQQKVVIGRWLERDADVLLFDEPTRGIDVGAKFEIYSLLGEEAKKGKALVVVSSELRELMLICDRIGVMSAGKLVRIFERGEWTQDDLLAAAFSGYAKRDELLTH